MMVLLFFIGVFVGSVLGMAWCWYQDMQTAADADALDADDYQRGYDEGLEAGRQLEAKTQTAKRQAAGRKAAETRKAK
jgi:hypothetical protein